MEVQGKAVSDFVIMAMVRGSSWTEFSDGQLPDVEAGMQPYKGRLLPFLMNMHTHMAHEFTAVMLLQQTWVFRGL